MCIQLEHAIELASLSVYLICKIDALGILLKLFNVFSQLPFIILINAVLEKLFILGFDGSV